MVNRVTCITKPNPHSQLEHITHAGGSSPNGRFYLTRDEVIRYIRNGYHFYVERDGYRVDVEVASRNGVEYIKTKPDATLRDNLLSLDQCLI
mgnify:CR=1 FL=1